MSKRFYENDPSKISVYIFGNAGESLDKNTLVQCLGCTRRIITSVTFAVLL